MIDSNQSINDLPYRARIMMTSSSTIANTKINSLNNLSNLKPMNSKNNPKPNSSFPYSSADLQPLQWLQQDAILSIAPLDNEEEFVPGKDDITSITTSPVKIEIVSESKCDESNYQNSTIADYYRYQAMRAAMATGHGGGNGSNSGNNHQPHNPSGGAGNGGHYRPLLGCAASGSNRSLCGTAGSTAEFQKPPFSYTHIIFMAIETSPNKAMTVNDIYVWCETHFPYYTHAGVGWKNSLRHNLSINKSFKKISRDGRGGPGRGAYWVVEPRERNNLIDAIRRSPCSLGNFPFLSNAYPWGTGNCYSNSIFPSANTLNSNLASLTASRSVVNNKLNSTTDLQSSSRGPLLRIGGHITDASNLIRSTPVIQRLNDSCNIIELPKSSQIISNTITLSTVPLIQFDQIKFESDVTTLNESTDSNDLLSAQLDEDDCRGKVFVIDDTNETDPEFYQSYLDIIRGLIYNEIEKTNSSRSGSTKNCIQHLKFKKYYRNNGKNGGVIKEFIPQVTDITDESESSIFHKDYSELSDTDFNCRFNLGLKKQRREKKVYSKLSNNRKSTRNRVNHIVRAPHSDHVYALLQDFLLPASENIIINGQNIDDKDSCSSTFAEEKSVSIDLSQSSLSKRSRHKLQYRRKSSKKCNYPNSDVEYFSSTKYEKVSKKLVRNSLSFASKRRKPGKSLLSSKLKNNSRLLKENSQYMNKKMYRKYRYAEDDDDDDNNDDENDDDDEDLENRYYDKKESDDEVLYSQNIYRSIKYEDCENSLQSIMEDNNNKPNDFDSNMYDFKRMRVNKDPSIKRKVGRPKKSEYNSNSYCISNDRRFQNEKVLTNKFKRKVKTSKKDLKYLRECNSNKKINSAFSNKEEQVAISVLANLQRKSQQERIKNMFNLSNFIERNNSDSNMS